MTASVKEADLTMPFQSAGVLSSPLLEYDDLGILDLLLQWQKLRRLLATIRRI